MIGSDLIFLHAMKIPRCNARVDKRFEAYGSLQFVQRGAVELFYDNTRHLIEAPAFWTCYPETSIRFHGYQGRTWHHRYVAIRGTGLVHLRRCGLFFLGIQPCPVREASRYAALMDRIIGLVQSPGSLSWLRAGNLLEQLLIDIAEWRQLQPRSEPWLDALMSSLENSDDNTSDYSAIARRLGMALSTLRRRFRKQVGISLHRYSLELRMSKARRLVGTTDVPLKDIAEQLGYENIFYFSRQFHQFNGVPPGVYRHSRQI
jgi:AraC family transcriptional regulator of arabinose operon